ncbi:MAG: nucleoside triphosphate pyrophosphatase [Halioglobus sp.]
MDLILASTSPYRRELLERLHYPFRCAQPNTEETPLEGESAEPLAARLALDKALSVASSQRDALVIGSDQVATVGGSILGKPGNHATAAGQLARSSGQSVLFYTAVALVCLETGFQCVHVEPFTVKFRQLSAKSIDNYLGIEQPYDCAGSFKCEGLGIALFESLSGNDPTSLQGLPLIALTSMLNKAGLSVI